MKFITFILALIVFAASLTPCFDMDVNSISDDTNTEIASSDANQHQPADDACSPFCICTCCATSVDVFRLVYKLYTPASISRDLPVFNHSPIVNSGISFWQPPKFS